MTLVSLWNQLANLAYPIVAVFLLTMAGEETAVLATVAFVGVAILGIVVGAFVLILYSNRMAAEIGDLAARTATGVKGRFHREPVTWNGSSFERFRIDVVAVLKRRWHVLTLATLAGSLTVFVVLLVSLRALQVPSAEVSVVEAFAAWSLARVLGSIPITPGRDRHRRAQPQRRVDRLRAGIDAGVVAAVLVYRFRRSCRPSCSAWSPPPSGGASRGARFRRLSSRCCALRPIGVEWSCRGARFSIKLMAGLFVITLAIVIVLAVAGAALATWGLFGAIIVFSAVAIGFAWFVDRRKPPRLDRV